MMKTSTKTHSPKSIATTATRTLIAAFCCLITALSFGGGGETGTGRRVTSFARIVDFGSIWVNGVEYFTESANITINGAKNQPESALKAGMVVRVDGTIATDGRTGQAVQVTHSTDLHGEITTTPIVADDGVHFNVYGLSVKTNARTVVAGLVAAELLSAGHRVAVSGLRETEGGPLLATRIDVLPAGSGGTILRGVAAAVNGATIVLGQVTFDISQAQLHGVTHAQLAAGAEVRVRAVGIPVNGSVSAQSIERAETQAWDFANASVVETEGLVNARNGSQFDINGIRINLSPATHIEGGTLVEIVDGALVEVEGNATGANTITANTIKFPSPEVVDAQGVVVEKATDGGLNLYSSANGLTMKTTAATEYKDSSNVRNKTFTLAHLRVGDRVQMRGMRDRHGNTTATRVERINPNVGFTIKTRLLEAQNGAMVLGGAVVTTDAQTVFVDTNGIPISSEAFYARAIGLRITARGRLDGAKLTATHIAM